jgi:protein-tyrosine phosphatase
MVAILNTLEAALQAGRGVYIHCYGGIGRTGTVVGCFLVRRGLSGEAALRQIAGWREGTPDGWKRSPETDEQREFVLNWKE